MSIISYNEVVYQIGSGSNPFIPIISVLIGSGLTLGYQWATRQKSISDNADFFEYYLEYLKIDISELLEIIRDHKETAEKSLDPGSITNGRFMFEIVDDIEFSSVLRHHKKKDKTNYLKKINELYSCFTLAKNEVENLYSLSSKYQEEYFMYEENFYKKKIVFEDEIKYFEERYSSNVSEKEENNLEKIYDLLKKTSPSDPNNDEQNDLKCYIDFDDILMEEIKNVSYYNNYKHPLYDKTNRFVQEWHLLVMQFMYKQDLYVSRVASIEAHLETILNTIKEHTAQKAMPVA